MTQDEMKSLQPGDIVRHTSDHKSLIVTANYGDRVTLVRTEDATNPSEWVIIKKAGLLNE